MRQNETAITIIALSLGLLLTWFMIFGILLIGQVSQLFAEGKTAKSIWLFLLATLASGAVIATGLRQWLKGIKASVITPKTQRPRQRLQEDSRAKLLALAQGQDFSLQEALKAVPGTPSEMALVLDTLLQEGKLEAFEEQTVIKYRLTKVP